MKNSTQTTLPHFNFSVTAELKDVTSRLIILINEEINEANCMVRNSAKLDRRTKQHTQFGVSTSDGSRDMARTKSWGGDERMQNHIASPTGIANNNMQGHIGGRGCPFVTVAPHTRGFGQASLWELKKKQVNAYAT